MGYFWNHGTVSISNLSFKYNVAYNIADEASDIMLKDLAKIIADFAGKEVVFELPDETEEAGYSKATKARLDGSKLKKLGWNAKYDIKQGLERTMKMLTDKQVKNG